MPYVTASVAVVGVWLFLFSSDGLVNQILGPLAPDPSWLINSTWAMPSIAIFVTWKQLGFFILLYLAALQNVPKELYEAASVDGAGGVDRASGRSPSPASGRPPPGRLLAIITGANLFTEPYLLTDGGGPDGASTSPVLLMYQHGIEQGKPDVASAIGVVLVIVVLIIAVVNRRFAERQGSMTTCPYAADRCQPLRHRQMTPAAGGTAVAPVSKSRGILTMVALFIGALAFLFPFYYMIDRLAADDAGHLGGRRLPAAGATSPCTTTSRSTRR